jgi:hypothetical protein
MAEEVAIGGPAFAKAMARQGSQRSEGTAKRPTLNAQHRTSNIEHRTLNIEH